MNLLHFAGIIHVHDLFIDELLRLLSFKLEVALGTRSLAVIHRTWCHFWKMFTFVGLAPICLTTSAFDFYPTSILLTTVEHSHTHTSSSYFSVAHS